MNCILEKIKCELLNKEDLSTNKNHAIGILVNEIKVLAETDYEVLPDIAKERLGLNNMQKNVLLRIVLRDLVSSISSEEANLVYSKIYEEIHAGETGYKITNKGKKE